MKKALPWILRIAPAIILLQTLYFKFTAHPDSVQIFSTLGMEPLGRIGIGVMELITAVLLLIPATTGIGAVLGLGVISGAIFFHFTKLGIEVNGDGGTLFGLAVLVFLLCLANIWMHRKDIPILNGLFKSLNRSSDTKA